MSFLTFASASFSYMSALLDAADNLGWPNGDVTTGFTEAIAAAIIASGGTNGEKMCAQLVERGIDVGAMMKRMKAKGICALLDIGQSTPLQWAVCSGDVAATAKCLAARAPADGLGRGGPGCEMTPLVLAVCLHNRSRGRCGNLSNIAPLLLAAGANPRQRTSDYFASKSLVQRAAECGNVELVALLLAAGADRAQVLDVSLLANADQMRGQMIAKIVAANNALEILKQHAINVYQATICL